VLASQFVGLINAQAGSTITITSEGQIVGTDRIERQGDVYTFTGDIFGIIVVEKDNITIDGAGYTIKGKGNGVDLNRNSKGPSLYIFVIEAIFLLPQIITVLSTTPLREAD